MTGKPTAEDLGIDPGAQKWRRSGYGRGVIEVAFVHASPAAAGPSPGAAAPHDQGRDPAAGAVWVLMRIAGDPARRVLVFDRNEWECFVDGARNGEFDDAADRTAR